MKKVALITVTYNAEKNLSFFLPSLERNNDCIAGIFFVDNNSSDKTVEIISKWKEKQNTLDIHIKRNAKNFGYAHAINIGIRSAFDLGYDYFCVTNNDIIFEKDFMRELLDMAEENSIDALGVPASINEHELGVGYTLDHELRLPLKNKPLSRSRINEEINKAPLRQIGFPHGGTIFFSRKFFETIGFYDPALFFGGDEIDFLYRVAKYNLTHTEKIKPGISLGAFLKMDNLTKHNAGHKMIKAKRMLQGNAHIYLKHRFTPFSIGLYKEQLSLIHTLAKGSLWRYIILVGFSVRALFLEILAYYFKHESKSQG
jgi:glycosyltransferase involved in cell wall biosynthesis